MIVSVPKLLHIDLHPSVPTHQNRPTGRTGRSGCLRDSVTRIGQLSLVSIIAIGCFSAVTSTTVSAADLLSVYQNAIESDATLAGQRFRYRADQQRIVQSRSSLRPQVGFNGRYGLNRDEIAVLDEVDQTDNYLSNNIALSVSQALYNRAARKGLDKSKGEVQLSALQLNDARQSVALRVSVAYFDVLAAQDNLEVARSEMSAISRQLDLAREMLDVGLGTKTDLFDTEARFKLAEVSEIDALNAIEDALRSLEAITGSKPGELALLNDDAPVSSADPADAEYWVSLGLARSLSILQADQNAEIARLQTEVDRYQRSPVVNLVYNDGRSDREGPSNDASRRDLSLQFNVPIYQGGAISSRTEEAHLRYQAAQEDAKQARRETERQIRNAFLDVDSNARRIEALLQAVAASESAVQARQEGFAAGISTNLDVLDAQRDLFAARRDYLRARYDHIIDLLELERAAGSLEDENIARINQWLSRDDGASIESDSSQSVAGTQADPIPVAPAPVLTSPVAETENQAVAVPVAQTDLQPLNASLGSTVATVARNDSSESNDTVSNASISVAPAAPSTPIAEVAAMSVETEQTVLDDVDYQILGANSVRVDVKTSGATVRAYSFAYLDPLRLSIDLYDVQEKLSAKNFEINSPLLSHVEVAQQGQHAQVILQLTQPVHYDNTTHNGGVVIVLRASTNQNFAKAVDGSN